MTQPRVREFRPGYLRKDDMANLLSPDFGTQVPPLNPNLPDKDRLIDLQNKLLRVAADRIRELEAQLAEYKNAK